MFRNRPALKRQTSTQMEIDSSKNSELEEEFIPIREAVQKKLLANTSNEVSMDAEKIKSLIEDVFTQTLEEKNLLYNRSTRNQMLEWLIADIVGYGPLEPLLNDPDITEIMVNGNNQIYVERFGLIELSPVQFENNGHLMRVIDRIVSPLGRRVDETSPMVDARLPSGYRVNVIIPPLSLNGPTITIRKFSTRPFEVNDLILNNTMNAAISNFLRACVEARVNMVVSGGTGTGKTTFLNVLSSFIPAGERVVTIEDTAELQLHQPHVVRLEKRPPNIEGKGEVTIRQLVINALRMRPDRIVVGECRGGEAVDMLQAMNTGHDGSMTTIHANSPRDAMRRIETMVMMAGMDLPLKAIREQVASSMDLVVQLERLRDGTRKVVKVSEVQGMEGDTIVMQELFVYNRAGFINGSVQGRHVSTGLRPRFMNKLVANGIELPDSVFEK
jgi:pilus assembly protein CpaF